MNADTPVTLVPVVVPVLLGLFGQLGFLLARPDAIRQRADTLRKKLKERAGGRLAQLLEHVRSIRETDDVLRGDGYNQPDLVGDYQDEVFRLFTVFQRLDKATGELSLLTWGIFAAFVVAIGALISVPFIPMPGRTTVWLSILIFIVEVFFAYRWIMCNRQVEVLEEVA